MTWINLPKAGHNTTVLWIVGSRNVTSHSLSYTQST